MKSLKFKILFVILFMTIGIAAVTTNLITNGSTNIAKNLDDFNVYFSEYVDWGDDDSNYVDSSVTVFSERKISFTGEFQKLGDKSTILVEVTNASKNYDADVTFTCSTDSPYLEVYNNIEDNIITATNYSVAMIQVTLTKSYIGENDLNAEITCTLNANAVERTSQGSGSVNAPVNPFYVGKELSIGEDDFYVIDVNDNDITLLTKYILDDTYRQNSTEQYNGTIVNMKTPGGWSTDVKDFDINVYSTEAALYVNNYVDYLKGVTGEDNINGNLITLMQLKDLGCSIDETYKTLNMYCGESPYKNIIFNNQRWATRSADGTYSNEYFVVSFDDWIYSTDAYANGYIRPIITISKDVAYSLIDEYNVGQEIALGDEKFNVISDNGTTVSMLAQKNVSDSTFTQTNEQMFTVFSSKVGWEYTPGPKEIDIQQWGGASKTVLNNYLSYLNTEYSVTVKGDLITLTELKKLGCSAPTNYIWGDYDCNNSQYSDWLVNGQQIWTRSASAEHNNRIWILGNDGYLWINYNDDSITDPSGVRPVITISKKSLKFLG